MQNNLEDLYLDIDSYDSVDITIDDLIDLENEEEESLLEIEEDVLHVIEEYPDDGYMTYEDIIRMNIENMSNELLNIDRDSNLYFEKIRKIEILQKELVKVMKE